MDFFRKTQINIGKMKTVAFIEAISIAQNVGIKKTKKTISKWMSINEIRQEIEDQEALLSKKRGITIAVWVILSIILYLFTDI